MTSETQIEIATMLRDSARDFATREQDTQALRARMGQLPGHDAARLRKMHELGWGAALIGESLGGAGMGLAAVAGIAQELGRALLGDVFLATSVLPVLLLQDRAALPKARDTLVAVGSGDAVVALAWQERADALAPHAVDTQVVRVAGGYRISGTKGWVAGATAADRFLVTARDNAGLAVLLVPKATAGVKIQPVWQTDGSAVATLTLDDVQVADDALVIASADGAAVVTRALDATAVAASAELIGTAQAAFDMTIAYMKTRVQYDQPIGSFQALQHKAVDLLVQRELAASVLEEALAAFDGDGGSDADRSRLASRCKARCTDAALRITRECIQLHGAIGYTHEYDLGLYAKRALVLAAWLGNSGTHRRRHMALAPN